MTFSVPSFSVHVGAQPAAVPRRGELERCLWKGCLAAWPDGSRRVFCVAAGDKFWICQNHGKGRQAHRVEMCVPKRYVQVLTPIL